MADGNVSKFDIIYCPSSGIIAKKFEIRPDPAPPFAPKYQITALELFQNILKIVWNGIPPRIKFASFFQSLRLISRKFRRRERGKFANRCAINLKVVNPKTTMFYGTTSPTMTRGLIIDIISSLIAFPVNFPLHTDLGGKFWRNLEKIFGNTWKNLEGFWKFLLYLAKILDGIKKSDGRFGKFFREIKRNFRKILKKFYEFLGKYCKIFGHFEEILEVMVPIWWESYVGEVNKTKENTENFGEILPI